MIYVLNINCWKHLRLIVACRLLWYFHECIHILYDLLREHTGHSKNTLPTTQEKTLHVDITRWLTPKSGWFYSCSQKWRNSIQSAKIRQGADCGSDHEHLIVKFWLKLKKVGKTTRPFRYDRNQIPYDYTVEVRNRFKRLDLIDRVPEELWMEVHDIVEETGIETIPMEKKCKKAKWLSEEALQIVVKRREVKSKGEKERYSHLNVYIMTSLLLFHIWTKKKHSTNSNKFSP